MMRISSTFLALILLVQGCGIFETRTPEPPQQGQSDYTPPTAASIVVDNLVNAVADRNVDNYIACLSAGTTGGRNFNFVPSPQAARQYQSIFQNWNTSSERGYFNNLISYSSSSSSSTLVLSSVQLIPQGPDSTYYSANYTLLWPNTLSGNLQQTQGNLQLYLGVDPNGYWSIYRWVDSGTSDSVSTWSDLKAQFSIPQ